MATTHAPGDDLATQIRRARTGDEAAIAAVVRRAGGIALPLAAGALGGREAAADVVQDIVVDVVRGLRGLKEAAAFDAWTRRIAARHLMRALGARRLRFRTEEPLEDGAGAVRDGRDHHDGVLVRLSVAAAVADLPPRQRLAVLMRYVHDLGEAEIAAALGCRPGTAASLLSRARATLRADERLNGLRDDRRREMGP